MNNTCLIRKVSLYRHYWNARISLEQKNMFTANCKDITFRRYLYHSQMVKITPSSWKLHRFLCDKQSITWPLGDRDFIFSSWPCLPSLIVTKNSYDQVVPSPCNLRINKRSYLKNEVGYRKGVKVNFHHFKFLHGFLFSLLFICSLKHKRK